jgi:NitT/TauT family transport system substrate-binding protein
MVSTISAKGSGDKTEIQPIRLGILPDADSLPFMAAEKEGLYESFRAPVELVYFKSPVERDAAFQAGQIDGLVGDTLGALFLETGGIDITITSNTSGRYGIAAAPGSVINSLEDLKNKQIGISSNTIIEYAVNALFNQQGINGEDIAVTAVPKMPVRMELLLQGVIPAAALPEPLYSLVIAKGAVPVADTSSLKSSPGIMIFSAGIVEDRTEDLQNLYRAYQEAANRIDSNQESYRDFLVETAGFPEPVRNSYEFVTYGNASIPSEEEISVVARWMMDKGLISESPDYSTLVSENWNLDFLD